MLPFSLTLRSDLPVHDQVIYAVTRAVVGGQLQAGDAFPSVRALSQALKINPNTAHRIVAALVDGGLLAVRPGIGTVVAGGRPASHADKRQVLDEQAERLVVAARRSEIALAELLSAIRRQWERTAGDDRPGKNR